VRIGLDGIPLLTRKTGIGKYTYELARALKCLPEAPEVRMLYGIHWPRFFRNRLNFRNNIPSGGTAETQKIRWLPEPLKKCLKQQATTIEFKFSRPDLFHATNYIAESYNVPTVVTIHDLSFLRYPETHPIERIRWLSENLARSLQNAKKIIADSEFTKKEAISFLGVDERRVKVIHLGVDSAFRPRGNNEIAPALKSFGLEPGKYLLSVGTLEPRKNLMSLLHAYEKLAEPLKNRWPLVIVGMRGWKESAVSSKIERMTQNGRLRALGFVPQEQLPLIYSGAALFIYPSIYEGFGLPPLEAMASGVPTIVSNRSSLPEIVEKAGLLIEPEDIDAIARAFESLIENPDLRLQMIEKGLIHAKRFTWRNCAEQTYGVYLEALNLPNSD
jgi:alpha-1,3-rhamnosyl/mannosyltransferase